MKESSLHKSRRPSRAQMLLVSPTSAIWGNVTSRKGLATERLKDVVPAPDKARRFTTRSSCIDTSPLALGSAPRARSDPFESSFVHFSCLVALPTFFAEHKKARRLLKALGCFWPGRVPHRCMPLVGSLCRWPIPIFIANMLLSFVSHPLLRRSQTLSSVLSSVLHQAGAFLI